MTLGLDYVKLGHGSHRYAVRATDPTNADELGPVSLIIDPGGAFRYHEFFTPDDARRLAWALIDQANKADTNSGRSGVPEALVSWARENAA